MKRFCEDKSIKNTYEMHDFRSQFIDNYLGGRAGFSLVAVMTPAVSGWS